MKNENPYFGKFVKKDLNWGAIRALTGIQSELEHFIDRFKGSRSESDGDYIDLENACRITEGDGFLFYSIDIPGSRIEDIRLEVRGETLWVCTKRVDPAHLTYALSSIQAEHSDTTKRDRNEKARLMQGTVPLPQTVDADNLMASYENGVLNVFIPKSRVTRTKTVQVIQGNGKANGLLGEKLKMAATTAREAEERARALS